ncbi:MAG: hypothetical protein L6R42_007988 [Xanthoria sp. 1 TBL-2021]|nr:MAG: hypothetical protein L6R42_007988 [Xanthoria sp. 1 TBL-2021]
MANRSQISSNWRAKAQPPSDIEPPNLDNDNPQDYNANSEACNRKIPPNIPPNVFPPAEIRGEDDPRTLQAIAEGRRLYVGNLPYMAKTTDIQDLFTHNNYQISHINMSIDPYSGRNPSYCFVELTSKSQADSAMQELSGQFLLGRPVKIGPGVAASKKRKATTNHSKHVETYPEEPVFQRWTRTDAPDHFDYGKQGRRVWVGGLPKMGAHSAVNAGVRELFAGFEIEAVSKVVIPATPAFRGRDVRNHRYLFVDFPRAEEARRAAKATDGRYAWGVKLRVRIANGDESRKTRERGEWDESVGAVQPA